VIVADCGEPVALSVTVMLAVRAPVAVGLKVMVMMQELSSGSVAAQLLVCEKLLALAPVMEMVVMFRVALPGFPSDIVMVCDEAPTTVFGNATGFGLSVACGAGAAVPLPVKVNTCGESEALSVIVSVAVRVPVACGVKTKLKVQVPPAATIVGQVADSPNSERFAPPRTALVIFKGAAPGLERVTD